MIRLISQGRLQFRETAKPRKLELIQLCQRIRVHELVIALDLCRGCVDGKNANHISRNGGGLKVFHDTDPLIAFLNIEPPKIFIAADGIADAFFPQVSLTQLSPFPTKLTMLIQQRHEIGRERIGPSRSLCPNDHVHGNLDNPQIHLTCHKAIFQKIIQRPQIGILPLMNALPVGLPALFQGFLIVFRSFKLQIHISSSCVSSEMISGHICLISVECF